MGRRNARSSPTESADIEAALLFAEKFLGRARGIEERAASETSRIRAAGKDAERSPMRDPAVVESFLLELFGFVAAIRAARDFIKTAVTRDTAGADVRKRLLSDAVVLHGELANLILHRSIIDPARNIFVGGERHGTFNYTYREYEIDMPEARSAFNRIQVTSEGATGMRLVEQPPFRPDTQHSPEGIGVSL